MEKDQIQEGIIDLLERKFQINHRLLTGKEAADQALTDAPFNLDGVAMTYLFFEVEKTYQIRIPIAEILKNYSFRTISGITEIVSKLT